MKVPTERLTHEDRLRLYVEDPETFAFSYEDADGLAGEIDTLRFELLELREAVKAQTEAEQAVTHRHKKRGSEYVLLGMGRMQTTDWHSAGELAGALIAGTGLASVDMREVAIYRSVDDGSLWVRPREEFEDGRFEALARSLQSHTGEA